MIENVQWNSKSKQSNWKKFPASAAFENLTNTLTDQNIVLVFLKVQNQLFGHGINTKKYMRFGDLVFIGSEKSVLLNIEEHELCLRYALPLENPKQ